MHTLDLPESNATKDRVINQLSISDQRVVVSKDMDFFYSHMASGRPWKLLLVKTGNIATGDLCELFTRNMRAIESALENYTLIELDRVHVTPVL
jgi:predicted nuclease of predicted toxin-antitoxin system